MSSNTDFGINGNKSDWFGMNFDPKILPEHFIQFSFNPGRKISTIYYAISTTKYEISTTH